MRKFLYIIILLFLYETVQAQDTLKSEPYDTLRLLSNKKYIINDGVTVNEFLIIEKGVTVEFLTNAYLICNGKFLAIGDAKDHIVFKGRYSANSDYPAAGIIIRGYSKDEIVFNFVDFEDLTRPLYFDNSWFRRKVDISFCNFRKNINSSNFLQVQTPQIKLGDDSSICNFTISKSIFYKNVGAIFFEEIRSNYMQIQVFDNLFLNNAVNGYNEIYTFADNILYGKADKYYDRYTIKLNNNSFRNNFLINKEKELIQQNADFGVYGSADSIAINDNFFEASLYNLTTPYYYDYSVNYIAPQIKINKVTTKPNANIPPHIYKSTVQLDEKEAEILSNNVDLKKGANYINLYTNQSVTTKNFSLKYVYEKDTSQIIVDTTLFINPAISNQGTLIQFTVPPLKDSILFNKNGYFLIQGLQSRDGQLLPDEYIGYKNYLIYSHNTRLERFKKRVLSDDDSLIKKAKIIPLIQPIPYKSKLEIAFQFERTSYNGTISNPSWYNYYNLGLGLDINYSINSGLTGIFSVLNTSISSTDNNSNNPNNFAFTTKILGLGLKLQKDFFNNRYYKVQFKNIQPSIFIGFEMISFTPQASDPFKRISEQINLADLRIGDSLFPKYSTSTFAIPFGVKAKWSLNNKVSISANITFHYTFSDYLDDISNERFPTDEKLMTYLKQQGKSQSYIDAAIKIVNPLGLRVIENNQPYRASNVVGSDSFLSVGIGIHFHL